MWFVAKHVLRVINTIADALSFLVGTFPNFGIMTTVTVSRSDVPFFCINVLAKKGASGATVEKCLSALSFLFHLQGWLDFTCDYLFLRKCLYQTRGARYLLMYWIESRPGTSVCPLSYIIIVWSEIITQVWAEGIPGPLLKLSRRRVNCRLSNFGHTLGGQLVCIKELGADNANLLRADGIHLVDSSLCIFFLSLSSDIEWELVLVGRYISKWLTCGWWMVTLPATNDLGKNKKKIRWNPEIDEIHLD